MKHLYFFLIVSFCSSLLSCTNDDSFLAHDFETQQNRALSIYTGNYNIYQIAKKVSLPSASTTKLNSVITNCCNDYPVIKWLHNYAKDKKYNFSDVKHTMQQHHRHLHFPFRKKTAAFYCYIECQSLNL